MIQIQELRVGNYVSTIYPKFNYEKVKEIKEKVVYTGNIKGIGYISLKPIPLTEEILLKCGFELKGIIFRINNGFANQFDVNYSLSRNVYYYDSSKYGIYNEVKLKYLHQLQNLYYCLTGEELNIKL